MNKKVVVKMNKYYLTYFEKGKDDFTMEELPESCDTIGKAKARACMILTKACSKALHTSNIISMCDGSYADLHDDKGNVVSSLFRRSDRSWYWATA